MYKSYLLFTILINPNKYYFPYIFEETILLLFIYFIAEGAGHLRVSYRHSKRPGEDSKINPKISLANGELN